MQHNWPDGARPHAGACLLIAASLCCCGTRPKVALDPDPETHSQRVGPPFPSPAASVDSEIVQTVRLVAELRGWDPRLSVRAEVVDQDRIVRSMLADVHAQVAPNVFRTQQEFLAAFGWSPPDFDFERDVLGRFARELSGVYCVTSQRILLARNIDRRSARRTLRHEVVHAFQDSRYDLSARTRWISDRGDYVAAIHALAEGEATCIELQLDDAHHLGCMDPAFDDSRYRDGDSDQRLLSVPRVVRHSLYAPYLDGVRYVRRLLRQGGWAAVERAWAGKLQSTRALFRGTEQEAVRLPVPEVPASIRQCQLHFVDMIGEESLRSFVWDTATPNELDSVLESLDGERAAVWQCDERCVAGLHLHFGDATGAAAYAGWLSDSWEGDLRRGGTSCVRFGTRTVSLQRHSQDIAIASVRPCYQRDARGAADNCPQSVELASRLADFHP